MLKWQKVKQPQFDPDKKSSPVWRFFRGCGLVFLILLLFILSPLLWPVYLGIAVLRPKAVVDLLYDTRVF